MGTILKSLLNLLQYFFCFISRFLGQEACGILTPWAEIEPAPPTLEIEILTPFTTKDVPRLLFFSCIVVRF